jgi:hypothetical protein
MANDSSHSSSLSAADNVSQRKRKRRGSQDNEESGSNCDSQQKSCQNDQLQSLSASQVLMGRHFELPREAKTIEDVLSIWSKNAGWCRAPPAWIISRPKANCTIVN